jgi:hypothetical protein
MTFSEIPATSDPLQTGWAEMGTIALNSCLTRPKTIDIAPSSETFRKTHSCPDERRAMRTRQKKNESPSRHLERLSRKLAADKLRRQAGPARKDSPPNALYRKIIE